MNTKDYLNRIRILDFQIREKEKQLDDLKRMQGNVRGFDYSGVKVKTSPHGDANIELAIRIMSLEQEITERLVELQTIRARLENEIGSLDNPLHVELLTLRYCELYRLEAIALEMNLSYCRIKHLHGEALKAFEKKISKS